MTVSKPGVKLVKFVGGPLDGRERYIMESMKKFEPQGLPKKGVYRPTSPGGSQWKWQEAK